MRRSAYYSRNKSYSRSYNAEVAEMSGRYPMTRAAADLGVSLSLFKKAIDAGVISSSEKHHVGKYAVLVDYWDADAIRDQYSFWRFCLNNTRTKVKKEAYNEEYMRCIKIAARESLKERFMPASDCRYKPFINKLKALTEGKGMLFSKIIGHLSVMCGGKGVITVGPSRINPVDLSPKSYKRLVREVSLASFARSNANYVAPVERKFGFVKIILDRIVRGKIAFNSAYGATANDYWNAAIIIERNYSGQFIFMPQADGGVKIIRNAALSA